MVRMNYPPETVDDALTQADELLHRARLNAEKGNAGGTRACIDALGPVIENARALVGLGPMHWCVPNHPPRCGKEGDSTAIVGDVTCLACLRGALSNLIEAVGSEALRFCQTPNGPHRLGLALAECERRQCTTPDEPRSGCDGCPIEACFREVRR